MKIVVTIEKGLDFHAYKENDEARAIRILIMNDAGQLIHACDLCVSCILKRNLWGEKREIVINEEFSTGKVTIHADLQNSDSAHRV